MTAYRTRLRRQRGQTMIEYVVLCVVLATALGVGMIDDTSVLRQLLNSFQESYQRFSYAISLPT
jgi:Flp pilus assembly pilin Flp